MNRFNHGNKLFSPSPRVKQARARAAAGGALRRGSRGKDLDGSRIRVKVTGRTRSEARSELHDPREEHDARVSHDVTRYVERVIADFAAVTRRGTP